MDFLTSMPIAFTDSVSLSAAALIVFCATTLGTLTIAAVLLYICFRRLPNRDAFASIEKLVRRFRDLFIVVFTVGITYTVDFILKAYFMIPRPPVFDASLHPLFVETDYGFPSGHASFFAALAVAVFFVDRKAGIATAFFALVVGIARILAGVHTPLDIIGGFILGIFVAVLVDFAAESTAQKPQNIHI